MNKVAFRASALFAAASFSLLAGCATPGENLKANVYSANQVNSRQEARVVNILAILPAQIEADNSQNRQAGQLAGGILGALAGGALGGGLSHRTSVGVVGAVGGGAIGAGAGSLVPATVLVPGVSITYDESGHTYSSAQVGQSCEYAPGRAIMVESSPGVTRIQPNAQCPEPKKA